MFLIGWIVLLTNHKALVFEVRVVGFVYVKGITSFLTFAVWCVETIEEYLELVIMSGKDLSWPSRSCTNSCKHELATTEVFHFFKMRRRPSVTQMLLDLGG